MEQNGYNHGRILNISRDDCATDYTGDNWCVEPSRELINIRIYHAKPVFRYDVPDGMSTFEVFKGPKYKITIGDTVIKGYFDTVTEYYVPPDSPGGYNPQLGHLVAVDKVATVEGWGNRHAMLEVDIEFSPSLNAAGVDDSIGEANVVLTKYERP